MSDTVSRRRFLAAAGAALGVGPLLSACGGETAVTAASCPGYGDLNGQDLQNRAALNYVDNSPTPGQLCSNCRLYNEPATAEAACGGCQLFAGPVAPNGWCSSWQAAA